jgi:hypothetical protein
MALNEAHKVIIKDISIIKHSIHHQMCKQERRNQENINHQKIFTEHLPSFMMPLIVAPMQTIKGLCLRVGNVIESLIQV